MGSFSTSSATQPSNPHILKIGSHGLRSLLPPNSHARMMMQRKIGQKLAKSWPIRQVLD